MSDASKMPRNARRSGRVPEPYEILTTRELAEWLKKSPRSIARMRFPAVAPGRFLFAHVLQHLEQLQRQRALDRELPMAVT